MDGLMMLNWETTPLPKVSGKDEKGLTNFFGENNCFINVVIQSLWHLDSFRTKFSLEKEKHTHQEACVYCALEIIFTQYEFSDESRLPPTALREAMAILFKPIQRFQLRELDDAAEAFDAVLQCLHAQLLSPKSAHNDSECKDTNCVPHKVFGIPTIEQIRCNTCGGASAPLQSTLFTVYTYSAQMRETYLSSPQLNFCEYLRKASEEDRRSCPNKEINGCQEMCSISHFITSFPEVFTVSIAWDSATPSLFDIEVVLRMISMQIDISNIFSYGPRKTTKIPAYYRLRGMICYYGKHYIAFFYNYIRKQWFLFDDTNVRAVGEDWNTIQQRCIKGHLQPSVLFYEQCFADQPVDTSLVSLEKLLTELEPSLASRDITKENVQHNVNISDILNDQSFIFLPSSSKIEGPKYLDFVVTRTNWLYRRQRRVFRFSEDCFKRIDPDTNAEKHIFDYKDVIDITRVDDSNIIINFYSGKEAQYINSDQSQQIIDVIKERAASRGHSFAVRNQ